jgi:hypothetical protein
MAFVLVAHDGFSGTEFTSLHGRSPDTVDNGGDWVTDVGNNRLATGGTKVGNANVARSYIADTLAADQAVELDIHIRAGQMGVCVRVTTGHAGNYNFAGYLATWDATSLKLYECAGGGSDNTSGWSELGSATPSFSAGDVLRLQVVGTGFVVSVNGAQQISTSDSAHASGQAFLNSGDGGDGYGDNYKTYEDTGVLPPGPDFNFRRRETRPAAFRPGLAR